MNAIGIAVGVAGTILIGYCIYFDIKRRSDPEYKKKVRERRYRNCRNQAARSGRPNMKDAVSVEKYFLEEIQLGKILMEEQEYDSAVEHLANAIAVYGDPTLLLQILQSSLPPQVFALLVAKVQECGSGSASDSCDHCCGIKSKTEYVSTSANSSELSSESIIIDDLE